MPAGYDAIQQVPRGKVTALRYPSKSLGFERDVDVYTPAGFNASDKSTRYPVLYLLHGSGDDQTSWVKKGAANVILDNLIARHAAVPMIVVMPEGFTTRPATSQPAAMLQKFTRTTRGFDRDLTEDLIPFIQTEYSTVADAPHRAMAGLSMGGFQTFSIGPRHLDTFAWLGVFSAGLMTRRTGATRPSMLAGLDAKTLNARLKLLWLSCGDHDGLFPAAQRLDHGMTDLGIRHDWHPDSGIHDWPVWKNDLGLFAQRIFR
jgi:enterochelin esterase-like enzyme